VHAPADGYTLLLNSAPSAINATLYPNLKFNFLRDMTPIAFVMRAPFVMEVNAAYPARTIAEFIADAKAHPGRISMASAGVGSGPHLAGELFKMMAGVDLLHVPYRGQGPATADLLAGQVQLYFGGLPTTIDHVRAGKLRALAVTTATRSEVLPDVPAIGELLPGYESSFWGGFSAPKGTPAEVIDTLNREINAALADARIKARLAQLGGMPVGGSPADFAKYIAEETRRWGKVVQAMGIKPE
jgi:tripartite-type tricarboxylate transporter receptor subunit TctC